MVVTCTLYRYRPSRFDMHFYVRDEVVYALPLVEYLHRNPVSSPVTPQFEPRDGGSGNTYYIPPPNRQKLMHWLLFHFVA